MKDSTRLDELHPLVANKAYRLVAACEKEGIDLIVVSTLRSLETQRRRYNIGRTVVGPFPKGDRPLGRTITEFPAGDSLHHYGLAFDVLPVIPSLGNMLMVGRSGIEDKAWQLVYLLARRRDITLKHGRGLESGHFFYDYGLSLDEIKSGARPPLVALP